MIWKFKSYEMWCCVRWLVLSVVNDHSALILKLRHLNQSLLTSWPWRWRHYDSLKHWELITSQKTRVFSNEVVRTSNRAWKTCIRITRIWAFLVWPSSCTCTCYDLVILNEKYIIHNCGCENTLWYLSILYAINISFYIVCCALPLVSGEHEATNKLMLVKSCWFNTNSICKITILLNLLLIIIINITPKYWIHY
jgi:hypothetical protein